MTSTRFAPGPATAYVAEFALALSEAADVDVELMHLCATSTDWSTLCVAARERCVTALVLYDAERLRVAVIGGASVVVETADGERCFDGSESWHTDEIERPRVVTLVSSCGPSGDPVYAVTSGVVPAAVVTRRLTAVADQTADPFELLFGHTIERSVESAAVRRTAAVGVRQTAGWVLVFRTGERVVVDRTIVVGRNPRPLDEAAPGPPDRLVRLPPPGVSRQHAVIRLDRVTASIEDLGSVNGTTVSSSTGSRTDLRPGDLLELAVGDVVDLGGDASFVVETAA